MSSHRKGGDGKWQKKKAIVAVGVLGKSRAVLKSQTTKRSPRSLSKAWITWQ
jgi:hypothetical protein